MSSPKTLNALVVGATGAVGSELVGQLLSSPRWTRVTTLSRHPPQVPEAYSSTADSSKLDARIVPDLVAGAEEASRAVEGVDAVFYAAGTTRDAAGSADEFTRVELGISEGAFKGAREAGARVLELVSAQGANPNLWASKLKPFHGLLYAQTKGKIEESAKAAGFDSATILRPGLLLRGDKARTNEKIFSKVIGGIPVADLARFAIRDAEKAADGAHAGAGKVRIVENAEIKEGGKP